METLKVGSKSNPNSVAGALANIFREKGSLEIQAIGAGALNQAVKAIIPPEDFKQLITSELKWLKEVEDYYKVYEQQGFGTIGPLIHLGYECDMRNFRTLLLMLYF